MWEGSLRQARRPSPLLSYGLEADGGGHGVDDGVSLGEVGKAAGLDAFEVQGLRSRDGTASVSPATQKSGIRNALLYKRLFLLKRRILCIFLKSNIMTPLALGLKLV